MMCGIATLALAPSASAQTNSVLDVAPMVLENRSGVKWELQRTPAGWVLGTLSLHGKPLEQAATKGLLVLRNVQSGEVRWLAASKGEKVDALTARMSGQQEIGGANFSWTMDVGLHDELPAVSFTPKWSVDKDLTGWEVCVTFHDGFANDWRVQSYPWAGNSEEAAITPMRYCGVPGVLVYRPDQS
jgi:hypothetical protein